MKNLKFLTVICTLCLLCVVCVCGVAACEDKGAEHVHNYGAFVVVKAPTCTEKGVKAAVCSECGNVETEEIAELGHDYGEWVITQAPTCTAKGVETRVCSRDETHTETRTVAELEHDYQTEITAPTCTEQGYTTYTCARCGFSCVSDYTAALNHDYQTEITAPTCTEQGYTTYTCARCGDSYIGNYVRKLGHDYEWTVLQEPTETEKGTREGRCKVCNEIKTESIPELLHEHNYTSTVIAPDCTNGGYTLYTCDCGDTIIDSETPALGHNYQAETTAPTCTEQGYTTYTCARCGDSYIGNYTPALGHDYQAETTAPTCTEPGYTTYTCARCEDSYIGNNTSALGHDYQTEITAPTCTEQGYTTYTCARCGDSYVGDYVNALGHTPSGAVEENRVEPTDTENGSYDSVVYCSVCGEELSRETITIDKLLFTVTLQNTTKASFTEWQDGTEGSKTVIVHIGETLEIPEIVYDSMSKTAKDNDDYSFKGWYYRDKTGKEKKLDLSTSFTLENLNVDTYVITVYAKVSRQWAGPY